MDYGVYPFFQQHHCSECLFVGYGHIIKMLTLRTYFYCFIQMRLSQAYWSVRSILLFEAMTTSQTTGHCLSIYLRLTEHLPYSAKLMTKWTIYSTEKIFLTPSFRTILKWYFRVTAVHFQLLMIYQDN